MACPTHSRGAPVSHINCQSIRNKLGIFKYHSDNYNFNLCTISETCLTQKYPSDIPHVGDYDLLPIDRTGMGLSAIKKGEGLAV